MFCHLRTEWDLSSRYRELRVVLVLGMESRASCMFSTQLPDCAPISRAVNCSVPCDMELINVDAVSGLQTPRAVQGSGGEAQLEPGCFHVG